MLNIFLGYACNLKCSYCCQLDSRENQTIKRIPDNFIENTANIVKDAGIKEIAYWGGEPTLYWDKIVEIHEGLINKGLVFTFIKFITNGVLITEEQVNKLNEWGAFVVISNHEEFGEPNWVILSKLKKSSISSFFNHKTLTAWKWFDFVDTLEQKYKRPFFLFMHWVRATGTCSSEYYLTEDDLIEHEKHLFELADLRLSGNKRARSLFNGHLEQYRDRMNNGGEVSALCFGPKTISIDLDGNNYACQHTVIPKNRIGMSYIKIQTIDQKAIKDHASRFIKSDECQKCPILRYCQGSCHLSETHEVDCKVSKLKARVFDYIINKEKNNG